MTADGRIGVVLFQLGGPDSLEAVRPFLYNLFCDPDIIDFPGAFLARRPLAKFIVSRRAPIVAEHYREIGGKSPLAGLTAAQAGALEAALGAKFPVKVVVAMRYWHPLTGEVIAGLKTEHFRQLVLLPLYPQYSKATTGSSFNEWKRQCARLGYSPPPTQTINSWHTHPLYIQSIVDNINRAYARFSDADPSDVEIVFSAHGVPVSLVLSGDPYRTQIEETVRLTVACGGWKSPHRLCFQSKVGPAEWLRPSLTETIEELARAGRRRLLIVPVAFVTEHIETLHEINIEARRLAVHLGIEQFEMMPALNDHPVFIRCLTDLVLSRIR